MDQTRGLDAVRDAFASLGGPIVVALSGGADSAVAGWAAAGSGLTVRCVHVDHGLPDSPSMRAAAADVARRLGLDLTVVEVQPGSGSETDLRDARYAALLEALADGELLVTAHTRDDQAETVLLNLVRGTGLPGLAGIPAARGRIRRPMLGFGRDEVRAIADRERLPYADDPANRSTEHLRNRVRIGLIPEIEAGFNPSLRRNLARMAETVSDALEPLQVAASEIACEERDGDLRVAIGPLLAASHPVRRWMLRSMLARARGPHPPSRDEVHGVEAALLSGHGVDVAGSDLRFDVVGPWFELSGPRRPRPDPAPLSDGLHWGQLRFSSGPRSAGPLLSKWRFAHEGGAFTVRAVEAGDEIAITDGRKDAREAIREAGIAADHWPVVVDGEGRIAWIPGARHAAGSAPSASGYFETLAEEDAEWAPFHP